MVLFMVPGMIVQQYLRVGVIPTVSSFSLRHSVATTTAVRTIYAIHTTAVNARELLPAAVAIRLFICPFIGTWY